MFGERNISVSTHVLYLEFAKNLHSLYPSTVYVPAVPQFNRL